MSTKIIVGNALEVLPKLKANSIHCSVSSPPYFNLRAYQGSQQCEWPDIEYSPMPGLPPLGICKMRCALGHEPSIAAYIGHLVAIYRQVYRVMRMDSVCWIVMGDSYCSRGGFRDYGSHDGQTGRKFNSGLRPSGNGLKQGDLMMVPHRLALALQADGWIIRNDLVWQKKSPMPESVSGWKWEKHRIKIRSGRYDSEEKQSVNPTGAGFNQRYRGEEGWAPKWQDCPGCLKCEANDGYILKRGSWRHTRAHEFIIHMVKKMQYFADQEKVREPHQDKSLQRYQYGLKSIYAQADNYGGKQSHNFCETERLGNHMQSGRNPRSVLTPKPSPSGLKHFAIFPSSLIEPLIKAACPDKCCPKCGKGWAPIVERGLTAHDGKTESNYPNGSTARRLALLRQAARERGDEYQNTNQVLGCRPTCECSASPGMKEIEVPYETGGDSGFYAPEPVPGTVLDPFGGAGTTGLVASRLGLNSILIEISLDYALMSKERIINDAPLFNSVKLETFS